MSKPTFEVPPFRVVAATLRKTTEYLARELVQPTSSPPDWTDIEWAIARSASAMQGISMLLANTLRWSGPALWQSFLAEQREQSLLCHANIGVQLERIDSATREARISCVALKGAAIRPLDLYAPGERPMGDIDLLVRADDLASTDTALRSIDYVHSHTGGRHAVYKPQGERVPPGFGEHIENPLKIEVHTEVAEPLPVRKVDITSWLHPVKARFGLNAYPDLAALMLHLLLHATGNMRAHALRQIQLHDIGALARHFGDGDWSSLLSRSLGVDRRWWMFPAVALTERYYPHSIPFEVMREIRAACPRALRYANVRQTLTDVSWSNLRIHALPGISWSRTPVEALRFIRSRVLPSRTALVELAQNRKSRLQPDSIPWYGLSHGTRILKWLFSRPPRVQTMISVQAALESANISCDGELRS